MRWLLWQGEEGAGGCSAHCSTSQPGLLGDAVSIAPELWALSFLLLCWKRGEESPSKPIPEVICVWAVAQFIGCEQPHALFLFAHLFPDSPPNAKPCQGASMPQSCPHSASPKGALSLPFPHPQILFGSMSMLLGKQSYREQLLCLYGSQQLPPIFLLPLHLPSNT